MEATTHPAASGADAKRAAEAIFAGTDMERPTKKHAGGDAAPCSSYVPPDQLAQPDGAARPVESHHHLPSSAAYGAAPAMYAAPPQPDAPQAHVPVAAAVHAFPLAPSSVSAAYPEYQQHQQIVYYHTYQGADPAPPQRAEPVVGTAEAPSVCKQ